MGIKHTLRLIFIIASAILVFTTDSLAQCLPYLGQTLPGNTPVRLVPDSLAANTDWQYHGTPSFSPDGNEMYYAIYRYNPGRIEIWFTECVDGKWISPKKASFSNNTFSNNNPYFSRNKDTLFFFSDRPGGPVFKVTRTNGVWSSPVALTLRIPTGYSPGWQFSIADNGNLYSELSKDGQEDIFLWRFVNGQYLQPEKLSAICSTELDFTPYIDPQERFIIFSSRRLGGVGNTDMYISKRNPDGTWSSPINLGQTINSGDVISPIISRDGKYFFFDAWVPGAAGGNPYWVDAKVIYNLLEDTLVVKDFDGNIYETVQIGNQIWMAENLRSTHYSDGTPISYYNYNNDSADVKTYGRLYSWAAAMKGATSSNTNPSNIQGIAPNGWHLPSKAEWQQLINYLGGVTVAGGKLKEAGNEHWISQNTDATNESGFTALPAGMHDFTNIFQWKGDHCAFSTSTWPMPKDYAVTAVMLKNNDATAVIGNFHPDDALSVRCIKNDLNTEVQNERTIPTGFNLFQNYPNPFNPSTSIGYSIPDNNDRAMHVRLKVFDVIGNEVETLVDKTQYAGSYEVNFSADNLMSGVYFYELILDDSKLFVKKMCLVK